MELKINYNYTYYIYPYIIDKNQYTKYILKMLKDENCNIKFWDEKEDLEIYNYFLPDIRKYLFSSFELTKNKIEKFKEINIDTQAALLSKYPCTIFEYKCSNNIKLKTNINIDKINIILFNTGISFICIKPNNIDNLENIIASDIKEMQLVKKIIGDIQKNDIILEKLSIDNNKLYKYSYTCLEKEIFNNLEQNIEIIEDLKIKISKLNLELNTFNSKFSNVFENQYFYTYILMLYKKIYIKKLNLEYKQKNNINNVRKEFVDFTQNLWVQETTNDNIGTYIYNKLKQILEMDIIYLDLKNKYDILYKELNIEKTSKINKITFTVMIISLIINIINFFIIYKL